MSSDIKNTTLFAEFVRKHSLSVEHLTENQLAEAIRQAIEAGDFIRHVRANTQMVVYVPFNEVARLRQQYNDLSMDVRNKYEAIQECMENMPQGGIGINGPNQDDLDAANEEGHPVYYDASYHQAQQAWLIAQRGLENNDGAFYFPEVQS